MTLSSPVPFPGLSSHHHNATVRGSEKQTRKTCLEAYVHVNGRMCRGRHLRACMNRGHGDGRKSIRRVGPALRLGSQPAADAARAAGRWRRADDNGDGSDRVSARYPSASPADDDEDCDGNLICNNSDICACNPNTLKKIVPPTILHPKEARAESTMPAATGTATVAAGIAEDGSCGASTRMQSTGSRVRTIGRLLRGPYLR